MDVQTIQDRYGDEASAIPDVRWIADATADRRILIGADQRIRYNPLERQALCAHAARCFTFPHGSLTADQMVERITTHLSAITQLAELARPVERDGR